MFNGSLPEGSHFNLVCVKLRKLKDYSIKSWVLCVYDICFSIVWFLLIRDHFTAMDYHTFTVYEATVLPSADIYISR